jgi:hypothetical protein
VTPRIALVLATAALGLLASPARADDRARHALEVDAFGGYDLMLRGNAGEGPTAWKRNGGGALAGSLAWRTPWVSPFVDVGYYPIYASRTEVDLGPSLGTAAATGSLAAMGVLGGLGVEAWRLRLRAGIGAYDVLVRSTVLGRTITPRETDMGYLLALRGTFLRSARLEVGAEVRAGLIVEADTVFASFGLTIGGDALTF